MPSSRSESLSRSNMRSKASSDVASAYPATLERICSFVIRPAVLTRAMTRLSSRSAGWICSGIGAHLAAGSVTG